MQGSGVRPISVREIDAVGDLEHAVEIYCEAFGAPEGGDTVTVELLRVLSATGHLVCAAYEDDAMVGFAAGLFGAPGSGTFHSHVTAVRPSEFGRGVGRAIKHHQAAWASERGVEAITWTFDPLLRRNAHFNVVRLGARVTDYHVNFYGRLNDEVNRGDETDRLLVAWDLSTAQLGKAAPAPEGDPVLAVDPAGLPRRTSSDASVVTAAVPDDIEAIRGSDPNAAREWRSALRRTLRDELAVGDVVGFGDAGYVIRRRSFR